MNLRKFLTGNFLAHWKLIALALLLAVIGIQQLRVTGLKSSLRVEKAAHATTIANYRQAQADATAKALAAKIETEKRHEAEREKADARAADLGQQYRAAVLRLQAAQRAASGTNLSKPAETAGSPDSAGGAPVIPLGSIMITEADALICATNQGRLEAAHDWALSINPPR